MLHYHAKKFFAPVIVTAHLWKNGDISVSLVSDLLNDLTDVEVGTTIFKWDSWTPVSSSKNRVTLVRVLIRTIQNYKEQGEPIKEFARFRKRNQPANI